MNKPDGIPDILIDSSGLYEMGLKHSHSLKQGLQEA